MPKRLLLLSGGAAQGLVRHLQGEFEAAQGCTLEGTFGAVGLMRDKLLAGEPCDVVILTAALIEQLGAQGHVDASSVRAIGAVQTGVALRTGVPHADVSSQEALKQLLENAGAIYFPDPAKATAGIHFMKVLQQLGLADSHASRFRMFPNGATAMAALADAPEPGAVGCTQVTEIRYTAGVDLIGLLPPPFGLATTYTAAVCTRSAQPQTAQALVDLLVSEHAAPLRQSGGFD